MTCRHCHKTLDITDGSLDITNGYCSYCGMAVKPPTEAENSEKPKSSGFTLSIVIIVLLFATMIAIEIYDNGFNGFRVGSTQVLFILIATLTASLVLLAPKIYAIQRGKGLPLFKRIATVGQKRRYGRAGRSTCYITFMFPDGTSFKFTVSGAEYEELKEGDRIIIKYKRFGKLQTPVFYDYVRLWQRTNL